MYQVTNECRRGTHVQAADHESGLPFSSEKSNPIPSVMRMPVVAAVSVMLAGCAMFSHDGGIDEVSSMTRERTGHTLRYDRTEGDAATTAGKVDRLLAEPLTPDTAVEIALMNNKGLQASLAGLGVAEAERVQGGRLRNPGFSFSRLRGGSNTEIERSIMFDIVGLLTLPARNDIERRRFEHARLQTASDAVLLAAETRRAYFNAVASGQSVEYLGQVKISAEAGAELAQQMAGVGNLSQLGAARQQVFYAEATAQLARAQHNAIAAREKLARLLGIADNRTAIRLPDRMPELPTNPGDATDMEKQAMEQRLDVQMAMRETEATASALGLTRVTGFVNVLDAGYLNKSETGAARENGYEISLEIPLFDWNSRHRKAQSHYMAAVNRAADVAIHARSEVREAYSAFRTAYDIARHYRNEIVPLRKKISDEVALRYNGMLASVFELLADSREQANSVNAAIEAQRNYWLAETDLHAAINGGTYPSTSSVPASNAAPEN